MTKTKQPETKEVKVKSGTILVEAPFAIMDSFAPNRLTLMLSDKQKNGLRALFDALRMNGAEVEDGWPVNKHQDAIRWILEKIADELPE